MYKKKPIFHILKDKKLSDRSSVTEAIKCLRRDYNFQFFNAENLGLDSENRIYEDTLEFNDAIISVDKLMIANSKTIKFYNCLILGQIDIMDKIPYGHLGEIYFDSSIFLGNLTILSSKSIENINAYRTNFKNLRLYQITVDRIGLSTCHIFHFDMNETLTHNFDTFHNRFHFFEFSQSSVNNSPFNHNQIINISDMTKAFHNKRYIEKRYNACNLLKHIDCDFETLSRTSRLEVVEETIKFLKDNGDLQRNRKRLCEILRFESIAHQDNSFTKLCIYMFGGFLNPRLFLLYGFLLWVMFAGLFVWLKLPFYVDKAEKTLDSLDALYFSGITLTTIGYGFISPMGLSKAFVIIEGALGIIVLSCFVVAMVRRFVGD